MNEYFSYPDKIRIDRAVFYKIAPIPLDVPFKDGTGNVRNASLFGSWMKIYDEDGVCGQGPCTPLMLNFFVPMLLKEEAKTGESIFTGRYGILDIRAHMSVKWAPWI